MKEMRGLHNYDNFSSKETEPVWMYPESPLFIDWYLLQSEKPEAEQAVEYKTFLEEVAAGNAHIPSVEQLSSRKIQELRAKNRKEEAEQ